MLGSNAASDAAKSVPATPLAKQTLAELERRRPAMRAASIRAKRERAEWIAQGIEAQRAMTENTGVVGDESPVAESDAPKTPNPSPNPSRGEQQ